MTNKSPASGGGIKNILVNLCAAVRFLTVLPLRWKSELDGEYFKTCYPYYPVVGIGIGLLGGGLTYIILQLFPVPVAAVMAVMYLAFISNCLHLDGLSDSGDGLLCAQPPPESLTIMKDSRVGAMGVIVVVFVLVLKIIALSSLSPINLCVAIVFMPFAGRTIILFTMATVPYARPEESLGSLFYNQSCKLAALIGLSILGLSLCFVDIRKGIFCLLMVLSGAYLFNKFSVSRIGGATGDTLGANCEIAEMMVALSFSATVG